MDQTVPILKSAGYIIEDVIEKITGKSPASPAGRFTPYVDRKPVFLSPRQPPKSSKNKSTHVGKPASISRSKSAPASAGSEKSKNDGITGEIREGLQQIPETPEPGTDDYKGLEPETELQGPIIEEDREHIEGGNAPSPMNSVTQPVSKPKSNILPGSRGLKSPTKSSSTALTSAVIPKSSPSVLPPGSRRTPSKRDAEVAALRASNAIKRAQKEEDKKESSRQGDLPSNTSGGVKTTIGREIGNNLRSYVEGMTYASGDEADVQAKEADKSMKEARSDPKHSGRSAAARPVGDNSRTFIEGMAVNSKFTSQASTMVGSQLGSLLVSPKKTEMKRTIGNNNRTHLEGLAPSTTAIVGSGIASSNQDSKSDPVNKQLKTPPSARIPSVARLPPPVSTKAIGKNEKPPSKHLSSTIKPITSVTRNKPASQTNELQGLKTPPDISQGVPSSQIRLPTAIKAVPTASAQKTEHNRPIGNNDRTHLEGMVLSTRQLTLQNPPPSSSRAKQTGSTSHSPGVASVAKRPIGNNERTHLEGMAAASNQASTQRPPPLRGTKALAPPIPAKVSNSETKRTIGNNERTHLEGMAPSTKQPHASSNRTNEERSSSKMQQIAQQKKSVMTGKNERRHLEGAVPSTKQSTTQIPQLSRQTKGAITLKPPSVEDSVAHRIVGNNERTHLEGMRLPTGLPSRRLSGSVAPTGSSSMTRSESFETRSTRQLGNNERTHLEGMLSGTVLASTRSAARPPPSKRHEVAAVLESKPPIHRSTKLSDKQKVATALGRPIGNNHRTHLEGLAPSNIGTGSPEANNTNTTLLRKVVSVSENPIDTAIKLSNPPPSKANKRFSSDASRAVGNNDRTYLEGMTMPLTSNTPISQRRHLDLPGGKSSNRQQKHPLERDHLGKEPTIVLTVATEMQRPVGNMTRTHLEGMEASSTGGRKSSTSNAHPTEYNRLLGDNTRTYIEAMQDSGKQREAYNTTPDINQTTMQRALGDNLRTHLEGMEDEDEMAQLLEERDPFPVSATQSHMQREIGDNQRSYIEGMAEGGSGDGMDDAWKKKNKRIWQRK